MTAEDIFISLVLEKFSELNDLENVFNYLIEKSESLVGYYNKWITIRDTCMNKMSATDAINFSISNWEYTSKIDLSELSTLREKILTDELILVLRIYRIAYNEAVHAGDELRDDR